MKIGFYVFQMIDENVIKEKTGIGGFKYLQKKTKINKIEKTDFHCINSFTFKLFYD